MSQAIKVSIYTLGIRKTVELRVPCNIVCVAICTDYVSFHFRDGIRIASIYRYILRLSIFKSFPGFPSVQFQRKDRQITVCTVNNKIKRSIVTLSNRNFWTAVVHSSLNYNRRPNKQKHQTYHTFIESKWNQNRTRLIIYYKRTENLEKTKTYKLEKVPTPWIQEENRTNKLSTKPSILHSWNPFLLNRPTQELDSYNYFHSNQLYLFPAYPWKSLTITYIPIPSATLTVHGKPTEKHKSELATGFRSSRSIAPANNLLHPARKRDRPRWDRFKRTSGKCWALRPREKAYLLETLVPVHDRAGSNRWKQKTWKAS